MWGSLLPAVWSFMLAARARGLGTCWTTLHLANDTESRELLGIPDHVMQGALIPVAHTLGAPTSSRAPAATSTASSTPTGGDGPCPASGTRRPPGASCRPTRARPSTRPPRRSPSTARCSRWAPTAASRRCTWARRPARWGGCCSPSTTTGAPRRTSPAGSGTSPTSSTRRSARWTPCRSSARPSTTPGLEGTVIAVVGDSPDGGGGLGHAAGLPVHRRRPRRGAGPHRLRALDAPRRARAAPSASTTSSPTRPTAAGPPRPDLPPRPGVRPLRRGGRRRQPPGPPPPPSRSVNDVVRYANESDHRSWC